MERSRFSNRNYNSFVVVYLDKQGRFRRKLTIGADFDDYQGDLKNLKRYGILYSKFGISNEQEDIILSEDFMMLLDKPFSEVKGKTNSLIAKLREAGGK